MRDISLNKMWEISRIFGVNEKLLRDVLSEVIGSARSEKGMSQEKLGNIADVDRSYISEIERGMRTPTLYKLFRIAKALEVEPREIVYQIQKGMKWND